MNVTFKGKTLANTDSVQPRFPYLPNTTLNHTTFHSTRPLRISYTVVGRSASNARCGMTRWYVSVVPGTGDVDEVSGDVPEGVVPEVGVDVVAMGGGVGASIGDNRQASVATGCIE